MTTETVTCTSCGGKGVLRALVKPRRGNCYESDVTCTTCEGVGWLSLDRIARIEAGNRLREERVARGESQTAAAARMGISVRELSDRERGRL
ncbi:MAG: helix-turn-helix domain-containing protein [Hyphomicrobiaceae bacterium]